MLLNKTFISFLLLFYIQASHAIDNKWGSPVFNHYTASNGLQEASVSAIIQDQKGMMWLGSRIGLTRFDGYTFKHYPSPMVLNILEDKQGYIWSATRNGLSRLDPRTEKSHLFLSDKADIHSISDNNVYSLYENDAGELWVGTLNGLNLYKPETQTFESYFPPFGKDSKYIRTIIQDKNGQLLLGTLGGGLIRFDPNTKTFESIALAIEKPYPETKFIYSLLLDNNDQLWIGTKIGLVEYRLKTQESKLHFRKNTNQLIYALYEDNAEKLWVGFLFGGICHFKSKTEEWHCFDKKTLQISNDSVLSFFQNHDGIFWVGLSKQGLLSFNLEHPFRVIRLDQPYNLINDIKMDRSKQLWIGTQAGMLKTNIDNQITKYNLPKEISDTYISKNNQIWVTARDYIGQYDPINDRMILLNALDPKTSKPILSISHIDQINSSEFVLSTVFQGLLQWNPDTQFAEEIKFDDSKPKNSPTRMTGTFLDSKNRLWSYGYRTLAYLNKKTGLLSVTEYFPDDPIFFYEMLEDPTGQLWLMGTTALLKINANGKLQKRFDNSLFGGAALNSMAYSENHFWIGTSNGLWKFDPATSAVQRFTVEDGLQSNIFHSDAYVDTNGFIFMGGDNGISVFHPNDIKHKSQFPPRVILTDLLINNQYVEVNSAEQHSPLPERLPYLEHLQLSYKQSQFFSIEFSTLDYISPKDSQYAYKLDGLNDDWIFTDASMRRAVYTSLSPGDYTFHVKAANSFDVWNEQGTSLNITVLPPWWRTLWAYFIYATLFMTTLFWFIHFRTKQSRLRAEQLEHEVLLRTKELQQRTKEINQQKNTIENLLEKKNTLFANVSHEFRTPLTLILGPLRKILNKPLDQDTNDNLLLINRSAVRLQGLVEQLLLFSKLSNFESAQAMPCSVKQVIENTGAALKSLMDDHQLQLSINPIDNIWVKLTPEDALQTIISNLLSNAAKYTPAGGSVIVNVYTDNDSSIHIQIRDSGLGVSAEWQDKIFERFSRVTEHIKAGIPGTGLGLALVKELVEINDGNIAVSNAEDGGAIFEVVLPVYTPSEDEIKHYSFNELDLTVKDTRATDIPEPATQNHDSDKPTVQIIDDTADMRAYLYEELKEEFNIILAEDGETGLQSIKQQVPDIIICDIMMPGIDGLEVLKRLRADLEISHTPLILLTAKDDKEYRIKGYKEQADDYITKPFAADELKARLHNILKIRKLLREQTQTALANPSISDHHLLQNYEANEKKFLETFKNVLDQCLHDPELKVDTIGEKLHMSQSTLNRKIKALLGLSPYQYLRIYRLEKAAQILKADYQGTMSELADAMGFATQQHFSTSFKEHFGASPKDFQ